MMSLIFTSYTMSVFPVAPQPSMAGLFRSQFFPKMPFYHTPEATKYLKAFLGEHYVSDDTPAFKALWRSYNSCQFVEDDGWFLASTERPGIS